MPIIKSMPVKKADWSYHYNYLAKDSSNLFSWGLNVDPYNEQDVIQEFQYNQSFLSLNSKAKNKYYHEVLSLPSNNMSIEEQEQALYDISDKYINLRAKDNLVLGSFHNDSKHLHCHLMISANSYMSTKSTRLSKKQFKEIQREVELYKNKKYPSLETKHYQKGYRAKNKQKQAEQEMSIRKRQTKKQKVLQDFKLILNQSKSKKELYAKLKNQNYKLYKRGKYFGIVNTKDNNRKYRLKTLEQDLDLKFIQKMKQMEQKQKLEQKAVIQAKQKGIYYGKSK